MKNKIRETLTIDEIVKIPKYRISAVRKSFMLFIKIYFAKQLSYPFADFHRQWIKNAEDKNISTFLVAGFRNSGKSTILSEFFPIWAIIGKLEIKNILIVTQTMARAEQILRNIKINFESGLLKRDLGPFKESPGPWNSYIIYLPKYNAYIQILSNDQNPRGLKNNERRPELIICDDMESLDTVRTQESRDKLYTWFKSELMPAGADFARCFFIGTPLHDDSVFSRLKKEIEDGLLTGVAMMTPIIDKNDIPLWNTRHKTKEAVEEERLRKGIPEYIWNIEYLLDTSAEENQIIKSSHIKYYDPSILRKGRLVDRFISVDPAAMANLNSCDSGIVVLSVWEDNGQRFMYVDAVYKKHVEHVELVAFLAGLARSYDPLRSLPVYVEIVGFQGAIVTLLKKEGIDAREFPVHGKGKAERLVAVSAFIERGMVLFLKNDDLISQLIHFDPTRNNDLVDALTQAIQIAQKPECGVFQIVREDLEKMGINRNNYFVNKQPSKYNWYKMARDQGGW